MIRIGLETLAASVALLLLAVSASGTTGPSKVVIHTHGPVGAIALDGRLLAYSDQPGYPACSNRVVAFDLSSKRRTVVSAAKGHTCTSCCSGVRQLAIAGSNLAWIVEEVSNTEDNAFLQGASLPTPREHQVATAFLDVGYDVPYRGEHLGNLVGSGALLVINDWWSRGHRAVLRPELDLVHHRRLRPIVSGPSAFAAQAVAAGRVAALGADGRVRISNGRGRLLRTLRVGPIKAFTWRGDAVALGRDRLLVLTTHRRLDVYDSRTGAHLHSWAVPAGATNLDVWGGVAVYADFPPGLGRSGGPYALHALGLATGKDLVLDRGQFELLRNLELGPEGLVYVKGTRTLVFVPLARVQAAVAGR